MTQPPRIVLAKVGLDGHDVGVLLVARHLMGAGFETIYLGKRNQPTDVANAALQEGAAAVGVSSLSGGLGYFAIETVNIVRSYGLEDVPVIAGGIDEPEEINRMLNSGVSAHFGPGSSMEEIVHAFQSATRDRQV